MLWSVMVMLPMAKSSITAARADVKAERTLSQCLSRSSPRGDPARLSRTQQFARPHPHVWGLSHHSAQLDQKKVAQLPPLRTTLVAPDPEDAASTTLELDERMARLCSKNQAGLGVDCPVSQDATGRRGCGSRDRSLPDVLTVVGSHPISLP